MWVWWAMHGVEPRPAEPWRRAGGRSKQLWASTRITIMMLVSIMYCTINSVLNAYRTPITGGGVLPQLVLRVKIPFKDTVKEHDSSCAMRHRMGLATCAKETPHLGCNNAAIRCIRGTRPNVSYIDTRNLEALNSRPDTSVRPRKITK